jgi:hypothetical protein
MTSERIRDALLESGQVADCVVAARVTSAGVPQTIAYVVPADNASAVQLERRLESQLGEHGLLCAVTAIAHVPLTEAGAPDLPALARIPLVSSRAAWEIAAAAGRDRSSFSLRDVDAAPSAHRVHLAELMRGAAINRSQGASGMQAKPGTNLPQGPSRPALSAGPPLPDVGLRGLGAVPHERRALSLR